MPACRSSRHSTRASPAPGCRRSRGSAGGAANAAPGSRTTATGHTARAGSRGSGVPASSRTSSAWRVHPASRPAQSRKSELTRTCPSPRRSAPASAPPDGPLGPAHDRLPRSVWLRVARPPAGRRPAPWSSLCRPDLLSVAGRSGPKGDTRTRITRTPKRERAKYTRRSTYRRIRSVRRTFKPWMSRCMQSSLRSPPRGAGVTVHSGSRLARRQAQDGSRSARGVLAPREPSMPVFAGVDKYKVSMAFNDWFDVFCRPWSDSTTSTCSTCG